MPRNNIQPRHQRRGSAALTDGWRLFLTENCGRVGALAYLYSDPAFNSLWTDPDYRDNAAREMWELHGVEITAEWIVEHPGTRPAAWWKFDAPAIGPRLKVVRQYSPDEQAAIRKHSGAEMLRCTLRVAEMYPNDEPQREYLERNGLLTAAEFD